MFGPICLSVRKRSINDTRGRRALENASLSFLRLLDSSMQRTFSLQSPLQPRLVQSYFPYVCIPYPMCHPKLDSGSQTFHCYKRECVMQLNRRLVFEHNEPV